jgi:pimeloyl-ACP methyl ester carboxylesterase
MSTPKPTIIIVPGSFAPPTIYSTTINHLRDAGYPAVAIQLPSTTKRMPLEPATMSDDASVIKRVVETVLSQGKQVVVICHSYGGTPTSQALVGLGVKRLVYLSAIVPKLGQSNVTAMGGEDGVLPMEAVVSISVLPLLSVCWLL